MLSSSQLTYPPPYLENSQIETDNYFFYDIEI
jgi:hypothetical protein